MRICYASILTICLGLLRNVWQTELILRENIIDCSVKKNGYEVGLRKANGVKIDNYCVINLKRISFTGSDKNWCKCKKFGESGKRSSSIVEGCVGHHDHHLSVIL